MRNFKKNNGGYSLVEFIIVLAIIAVLTGLSSVTIAAISSARATSSKESFNQALSTLQTLTNSQEGDTVMRITRNTSGSFEVAFGSYNDEGQFEIGDGNNDVTLGSCEIYYTASGSSTSTQLTSTVYVQLNKSDGAVIQGAGVYTFCKYGTTRSVGQVTLNKTTGAHYTGSVKSSSTTTP